MFIEMKQLQQRQQMTTMSTKHYRWRRIALRQCICTSRTKDKWLCIAQRRHLRHEKTFPIDPKLIYFLFSYIADEKKKSRNEQNLLF